MRYGQRMPYRSAAAYAAAQVAHVRDDPLERLALLRRLYEAPARLNRRPLPYWRAASAFMGWQLRRGLLNPLTAAQPGSPWWRAVNEALLRDTCEARALALGHDGQPTGPGVSASLGFIRRPTVSNWYRAHNITIVTAYLANEKLALREGRVERFFLNLVLMRVLYAHALVAAPRLALGRLALLARPLGDPRALNDPPRPPGQVRTAMPTPHHLTECPASGVLPRLRSRPLLPGGRRGAPCR